MTKKQYLRQGYKIKIELENEKEVLKELQANLDGLQALRNSEKVQGGPIKDDCGMVNKIDKILEIEKKIKNKIYELNDFQSKLLSELDEMENRDERILMKSRYILNQTWEQIAEKVGYSLSQTYRIHGRALENFKMTLNESINV